MNTTLEQPTRLSRDSGFVHQGDQDCPALNHATGNLRAIHILLGHTNIEHTVRYLGVDVDDALTLSERTEL